MASFLFRSIIFARFAEQFLKDLLSCRSQVKVLNDRSLLGSCFRDFALPVLEYCSAVWCSAADIHLQLLDRVVSGPRFVTGGVLECDIAHRRSVAVLCMLYKIN